MTLEQLDRPRIPRLITEYGVTPRCPIIFPDRIDFGQGHVCLSVSRIQPDRLEQKAQRFILPPFDAVELRQVKIRLRIGGLAADPGALLGDLMIGLVAEGRVDHFFAPETHFRDPIRIR